MLTFRHRRTEGRFSADRGFKAGLLYMHYKGVSYPMWDDPGEDEEDGGGDPLGDMRGGGWMSPETPAPFGVLLA